MNFKKIIAIYKKELLDLLRDRRTVVSSIVIPIILYPLIMIGFSSMMSRQEMKMEQKEVTIYVQDNLQDEKSEKVLGEFEQIENLQLMQPVQNSQLQTYLDLLQEDSIQAVVTINDSINSAGYEVLQLKIYYNNAEENSSEAYSRLKQTLPEIEKQLVASRLQKLQVDTEVLDAINTESENVAPPTKMFGFILGRILPYLLILMTISSGSVVASDLVAGEKERGTLETILVSAADRMDIVIGKFLTIITFSIITVLLNLMSMFISIRYILIQMTTEVTAVSLPIGNFVLILVIMIPLVTLFSAILLSLSTYSRNIKEAQSYQMPILFTAIILSMISFLPGFKLNYGFALIPIVNFALLFQGILTGSFHLGYFLTVIGSTLVLDVIAVKISLNLFNNEKVLFRTAPEESYKFWGKKNRQNIFTTRIAIILYFAIFLALIYLGGKWQTQEFISGMIKTQLLLILLPVLVILRISKQDTKKALQIKASKPLNYLVVLLGFIPILIVVISVTQLINYLFPIPESYLKNLSEIISMKDQSLWLNLGVIALLPAICEEVLFRGYFLRVFSQKGFWKGIVIVALMFGAFHMSPYRILPTGLLGVWLAYLALKGKSLHLPILAHFLNNGVTVIIDRFGEQIPFLSKLGNDNIPLWWALPALVILYFIYKFMENYNTENVRL
ncbi:MAG: sodium transport system permease protein [Candidatus Cloacimonadota bacterium]|jgi:sodium transport system permease protein|nr:sodium transport system permease protein [Candidatus Cloacimonadota bacterium]